GVGSPNNTAQKKQGKSGRHMTTTLERTRRVKRFLIGCKSRLQAIPCAPVPQVSLFSPRRNRPMYPPLISRGLRARWLILAFAIVASPRAASAADPVMELAQLLQKEIDPNAPAEVRKEVKRQKELLDKGTGAVTRLADIRSALLLPGWKRDEIDPQSGEVDPF